MADPPPPSLADAPPTYAPSSPQILIAPLPDSPSFFWGRTVQGEVFVKGLGDQRSNRGVKRLTARLDLINTLPGHPTIPLHEFNDATLYPASGSGTSQSTSAPPSYEDAPFPSSHRFSFALPPLSPLPGTLNLSSSRRGEVKYTLTIILALTSGATVEEVVPVDGTPQDVAVNDNEAEVEDKDEVEAVLEREGVKTRFVMETATPRLGDLVRLGVEVKPMERQKTGVAGLSTQPNPTDTLRPLRRVRLELYRKIKINDPSNSSSSSSSSTMADSPEHLTLLFSSGKSLRYPGTSRVRPPLRVMFTLPTAQLGSVASDTYGEITSSTPYHEITFFVRITIGFGGNPELINANAAGPSTSAEISRDWYIEQSLVIRPRLWVEPRQVIITNGHLPASGLGTDITEEEMMGLDEATRAAYRAKGLDIVGQAGTYRAPDANTEGAGPSGVHTLDAAAQAEGGMELPAFFESQAQMQAGDGPVLANGVPSQRLVPIQFDDDPATAVGGRDTLGGELGTWVEYDGYETFSMAPPPAAVSYGVDSSMDPPQEGDEDMNVVGGMAARLGLSEGALVRPGAQAELMEQLGLGGGTRVVDLQDDLPPGIDEPSLPRLPAFHYSPPHAHEPAPLPTEPEHDNPPSFAASEAAQAVGGVASAQPAAAPAAPPGYFGTGAAGLPPYSQG